MSGNVVHEWHGTCVEMTPSIYFALHMIRGLALFTKESAYVAML